MDLDPVAIIAKTSPKTIRDRIEDCADTKLRLRYAPYYKHFDSQKRVRTWLDGQELVMLSSNDYLGLSFHPKVLEAGERGIREWGASTSGARVSNGSRAYHQALEERLAAFLGKPACHTHSAGYLSCMAAVQGFALKDDVVFLDRNIHSSLWSGLLTSRAKYEKFAHNNPADLKRLLDRYDPETPKMVVFEGIYSMEGHVAPVQELVAVAREANCFIVMDDAHGVGILGRNGRGTADHFGVTDQIDLICGSFSKALGSIGGFVCGSRSAIEYLRTHSKQTLFSAAISPAHAYSAHAAIDLMDTSPALTERLWSNAEKYRKILTDLDLDTWGSTTPLIPIVLGDKRKAFFFWQKLLDKGVFTVMAVPPAVPPKKELIRTSITAAHTTADLERIATAMAAAKKNNRSLF